ncbi:MAG: carboxypeptidase-like regulatory domain-containing protein [Verrucomicrobiota bacterium]
MFLRTTGLITTRKQHSPDRQATLVRTERLPKLALLLLLIASSGTAFLIRAQGTPPQPVSGVVLAAGTGKPISNALVRISSPAVDMRHVRDEPHALFDGRTDAQGRFVISVPVGPRISLDAFAPGYESGAGTYYSGNWTLHDVAFPSNRTQEITIKLRRALYVAGVVVDAAGQPCPDVVVESTLRDSQSTAYVAFDRTDAAGRFQIFDFPLERLNTGSRGQLTFRHPEKLTASIADVYALTEAARSQLQVTLASGHAIHGVLTAGAGVPVADTVVEAIPATAAAAHRTTRTDAAGRFQFSALPEGKVKVQAHSATFDQLARKTIRLRKADAALDLQLAPVVLQHPPRTVRLFGMELADVTPELQTVYDLVDPTGVLILDPGPDHQRLDIGPLDRGLCFWIVGERPIKNLREFVAELLRIHNLALDPATPAGGRGSIRVVYRYRNLAGTNTQRLKLTDLDIAELKKLQLALAR